MHVALVDPVASTPAYDHHLASALARRGHRVDLLTSPFPFADVPAADGYRREEIFLPLSGKLLRRNPRTRARLAAKGLEYLPSAARLVRRIVATSPDVVHVQWLPVPRLDVRWLERIARVCPIVFTAHHALPRDEGRALGGRRDIYEAVDRIVVHTERGADELAELGIDRERVVYIRHAAFAPPAGHRIEPPRGATLLFFGLLRAYKGLDVLIAALPEIAARVPDVRLVIAGDPLDPVDSVRALAAELGVAERIEWRLGYASDAEVTELMDAATLVVLPYRRTDASGVLATAIGHGRPAVVSDVGALGETVREFDAGLAVPPGDVAALAEACTTLLASREALERAFRGTRAAADALSWDTAAGEHERVYEAVIGSRTDFVAQSH